MLPLHTYAHTTHTPHTRIIQNNYSFQMPIRYTYIQMICLYHKQTYTYVRDSQQEIQLLQFTVSNTPITYNTLARRLQMLMRIINEV